MTTDKIRDYNFKKNIIRCDKCNRKIFHLNSDHYCIKYEPCSIEEQIIADDIDDKNNRNKDWRCVYNGIQYTLDDLPLPPEICPRQKLLEIPQTDSKPIAEYKSYVRYECEFCGQQINDHQKEKHQATKKCQKMKARYYRE